MRENELVMARAAVLPGVVAAGAAAGLAAWLRGPAAALTAAGGAAVVVGSFALTGWSLARAARIGLRAVKAVALGGFVLRLVLYGLAVWALAPVEAIDRTVLALSVAAAVVLVLAYEAWLLVRSAEFWWVDPEAREGT